MITCSLLRELGTISLEVIHDSRSHKFDTFNLQYYYLYVVNKFLKKSLRLRETTRKKNLTYNFQPS